MTERWAPVPDFPGYEVSDMGQVRSRRGLLKPWRTNGYLYLSLRRDGKTIRRSVNRLILLTFIGTPTGRMDSCHRNGDKSDNRLANLYWGTRSQNIADQVRHGRHNNARKTHCPKGHEFTPENTYIVRGASRQCVTCTKARALAAYEKRRAVA